MSVSYGTVRHVAFTRITKSTDLGRHQWGGGSLVVYSLTCSCTKKTINWGHRNKCWRAYSPFSFLSTLSLYANAKTSPSFIFLVPVWRRRHLKISLLFEQQKQQQKASHKYRTILITDLKRCALCRRQLIISTPSLTPWSSFRIQAARQAPFVSLLFPFIPGRIPAQTQLPGRFRNSEKGVPVAVWWYTMAGFLDCRS